jgi:hypothetical protein
MDDLQLIPILQSRLRPRLAADDFAIELNRDAVGLHPKLLDQRAQGFRF